MIRKVAFLLVAALALPKFATADTQANIGDAASIAIPTGGTDAPAEFKTSDGKSGWAVKVSSEALTTPAYGSDNIFIGSGFGSNTFCAYKAATGAKAWHVQTLDNGPTAPIHENGVVVYNTESCHIEALAADTGTRLWSELIGSTLYTQPAIADGLVFTAHPLMTDTQHQGRRFRMLCMDLKTGKHYWDADITGDVLAAPVVANHKIYFTCSDGNAFCLRQQTGGMEWQEKYMGAAAPLVANANLVMMVKDAKGNEGLKRFDAEGGDPVDADLLIPAPADSVQLQKDVQVAWDYQGPRPALAKGCAITAQANTLSSIELSTGKTLWRTVFHGTWGANHFNPVAVGAGKIYATTNAGHIICLNQADGSVVFNYATGRPFATQPILAQGNIYATTTGGQLICLKTGDKSADGWYAWGGNAAHNKQ
jgi:outer membrane protein assembly factor BamB